MEEWKQTVWNLKDNRQSIFAVKKDVETWHYEFNSEEEALVLIASMLDELSTANDDKGNQSVKLLTAMEDDDDDVTVNDRDSDEEEVENDTATN